MCQGCLWKNVSSNQNIFVYRGEIKGLETLFSLNFVPKKNDFLRKQYNKPAFH